MCNGRTVTLRCMGGAVSASTSSSLVPPASTSAYYEADPESEVTPAASTENSGKKRKPVTVDDFDYVGPLGKGGYGLVVSARRRCDGEMVALKVIPKARFLKNSDRLLREKEFYLSVKHPFIGKLHCSFQTEDFVILCLLDHIPGRLSRQFRRSSRSIGGGYRMGEKEVRFYIAEVALAIRAIHLENFIYRDLKVDNILLDQDGHVQLIDFGLVERFYNASVEEPDRLRLKNASPTSTVRRKAREFLFLGGHGQHSQQKKARKKASSGMVGSSTLPPPAALCRDNSNTGSCSPSPLEKVPLSATYSTLYSSSCSARSNSGGTTASSSSIGGGGNFDSAAVITDPVCFTPSRSSRYSSSPSRPSAAGVKGVDDSDDAITMSYYTGGGGGGNNYTNRTTTTTTCRPRRLNAAGTPGYVAPEILRLSCGGTGGGGGGGGDDGGDTAAEDRRIGQAADFWAIGSLTYKLLMGHRPFPSSSSAQRREDAVRGRGQYSELAAMYSHVLKLGDVWSDDVCAFITELLDFNTNTRLGCGPEGFEEFKRHPFFRGLDWGALERRELSPPPYVHNRQPSVEAGGGGTRGGGGGVGGEQGRGWGGGSSAAAAEDLPPRIPRAAPRFRNFQECIKASVRHFFHNDDNSRAKAKGVVWWERGGCVRPEQQCVFSDWNWHSEDGV